MMASSRVPALLRAALQHLPAHGFTTRAILVAAATAAPQAPESGPIHLSDSTLNALFPGPPTAPTSAPRRLFATWDNEQRRNMWHRPGAQQLDVAGSSPPSSAATFEDVANVLAARLRPSAEVKNHLTQALSLETAVPLPTLPSKLVPQLARLAQALPVPGAIPNPAPLVQRAFSLADEACAVAGWKDEHGPDWYAVRGRLGMAYLVAELHLIAQPSSKVDSSVDLLHRIARNRDVSLAADMGRALQGARGWAEWGGRGWLGLARSWGF